MKEIYTVGHSIYKVNDFLSLLKSHNINTIVDVRSTPYSKFASQYNKELLEQYLKQNEIYYIFMGNMLGARYENKNLLFDNGSVNFEKVQKTKLFQEGITRLNKGITKGYKIALMCAEKEAFDCHRFGLISSYISKNLKNIKIKHIYPNKVLSQKNLENQLIKKYYKEIDYLGLETDKTPLEQAYVFHNMDIKYK